MGMPGDSNERTVVMRCLGALFTQKSFAAFAPQSVLEGVFSRQAASLQIWQQWRCNAVQYFPAVVSDPSDLVEVLSKLGYVDEDPAMRVAKEALAELDKTCS